MAPRRTKPSRTDDEASLSARAAWLYFSGGMTQGEIAKRLGVPSTKAHRLVARATREGLVRVFVDASVSDCVALEEAMTERYGLTYCRVAPDLDEGPLPLKALGLAGARFLRNALESGDHEVIGVGHGRTIGAMVDQLPSLQVKNTRIVSLLGGLTRRYAANPYDVIHRIAERTGAEAYMLPVPLYANTVEDKAVLLAQVGVADVIEMWDRATLMLTGVGEVAPAAHLFEEGLVDPADQQALQAANAVGEVLGHYFDSDGAPVLNAMESRVMSPDIEAIRGRNMVAIAGGVNKAAAIGAALRSGLIKGLITDESTARRLNEMESNGGGAA